MNVLVSGMHGLGDNLYQRSIAKFIKGPIHLQTPWPQIYADLPNVICVRPNTKLRTQAKNEAASAALFGQCVGPAKQVRWHYTNDVKLSILQSLMQQIEAKQFDLRGPVFAGIGIKEPYIVVRPVCLRREWTSDSRNPLPQYIAAAIEHLRKDFTIVSVADLLDGHEWALDPLPHADIKFHAGELNVEKLLGLVQHSAAMVGGVGWIVPAALAYSVPLFLIYGGWGHSNGPHRLFGPGVDASFIDQVMPDVFCACNSNRHLCDKRIASLDDRARAFAARLVRPVAMAS